MKFNKQTAITFLIAFNVIPIIFGVNGWINVFMTLDISIILAIIWGFLTNKWN